MLTRRTRTLTSALTHEPTLTHALISPNPPTLTHALIRPNQPTLTHALIRPNQPTLTHALISPNQPTLMYAFLCTAVGCRRRGQRCVRPGTRSTLRDGARGSRRRRSS